MVHVDFDPMAVSLDDFFQEGGGHYFQGFPYQRGYGFRGAGIGSIFRSLIRYFMPIAKSAGKAVGKEALVTSAAILDNIAQGAELKDTILTEAKKGTKRLAAKYAQSGSGIPRKRRKVSKKKPVKRKKPTKKKTGGVRKKKPVKKKKRITKKSLLGRSVLREIALKNPTTNLGFY